jgi:ribosomal protein L16 Arg81 hydroxylase
MLHPMEYNRQEIVNKSEKIILDAGDFLYHPAGIWHAVECLDDSFTINLSMKNLNKTEIIGNALKHLMNQDPELRQNMTFDSREDFNRQIQSGIEKTFELLKDLTPEIISPMNETIPRYVRQLFHKFS